jgi:hypothetical protein
MLLIQLVPFVLIPCACLIGLFLNWKIIQTLKDNEKKELKEDFYKYMSANAKFNCLYCLIFVFYPINSCEWRPSYHFCSSVFTTQTAQYFKIIVIAYFGEVFKMCANISYLMMTLNRYLLVGKDHSKWLVTVAKLEFKWVIRGSFLFSVLINIGHGWEYQAIYDLQNIPSDSAFDGFTYLKASDYSYSDYPFANQGQIFFFYTCIYFVINFGLFFLLNTFIEVKIVSRLHKEIVEKRKRMDKLRRVHLSIAIPYANELIDNENDKMKRKKIEEEYEKRKTQKKQDEKKERRVLIMVIVNSILNFIFRAPDVLVLFENYNIWYAVFPSDDNEYLPGLFNLLVDVGYLAYIVIFSTNFVVFYKFNSKFREAMKFFRGSKTN